MDVSPKGRTDKGYKVRKEGIQASFAIFITLRGDIDKVVLRGGYRLSGIKRGYRLSGKHSGKWNSIIYQPQVYKFNLILYLVSH